MMEGTSLFSLPEGMQVSHIQITENSIVVEIVATSPTSRCPLCSEASESIHCTIAGSCVMFPVQAVAFNYS